MTERIRILFLSANPWTTSRILVDEEAREIFEKLQEGSCRDKFELIKHEAIRALDLQRLLMMHEPHIVHFSGHGSKRHKLILGGTGSRGKEIDHKGLVGVFKLYRRHLRLVLLNACFTMGQARALSEVIDYSVGTGKGMGDKGGVAFAGAFYRALGFGKSVKESFESAKAELGLTRVPRTSGIELFVRNGISEKDPFPPTDIDPNRTSDYPRRLLSNPFARKSGNCETFTDGDDLSHEAWEVEKAESSVARIPASPNIEHWFFQQTNSVTQTDRLVLLVGGETSGPTPGLIANGDKRSAAALARLSESKRVKKVNPRPGANESETASSTGHLHECVAMTLKVERSVVINVTCVSHKEARRGKARRNGANKKPVS